MVLTYESVRKFLEKIEAVVKVRGIHEQRSGIIKKKTVIGT